MRLIRKEMSLIALEVTGVSRGREVQPLGDIAHDNDEGWGGVASDTQGPPSGAFCSLGAILAVFWVGRDATMPPPHTFKAAARPMNAHAS